MNLTTLIALCNIPEIQGGWEPKRGDWYAIGSKLFCLPEDWWVITPQSQAIFLPVGFNPETGNHQIDDLLLEAGGFDDLEDMRSDFFDWWRNSDSFHIEPYCRESDLTLKLRWLGELVKEER